ncbi:tyrosine-type recombinase/integrase [Phormidium sp. FACHB-592]|uniref:Tyrosine-type recombinase/integrase n=1 Tax=Stenomitos frigidus AS-A4 TaxID=2933935 RepID=A0ABV0KTM4_9CYAN|nr:tyrosine-type recombinase/integrase [Phormidium sp. FACHB-592]MBD2076824.1 tyrosine-type recombinase/integrase [Phormidium sp. FACHB-592]
MPPRPLPTPVVVLVNPAIPQVAEALGKPLSLRELRVQEFLQARSLQPKSRKAYQRDLDLFMTWTNTAWNQVTRRQVAQFKQSLLNERRLAPNSVNRTLQTLKSFFKWLVRSEYVSTDPTTEIQQEHVPEPQSQDLEAEEVERIYLAIEQRRWHERDRALWTVLLHGLRAEEASNLNVGDCVGGELVIRQAKHDSTGEVPLTKEGQADLEAYLQWREAQVGQALAPDQPFFVSYSPRNRGQRLGYSGIRQVMDQLAEATGIDLHSHRGRHTFATRLIVEYAMDPTLAMALTRHRDPRSFRRYTNRKNKVAAKQAFLKASGQLSV